MTKKDLLKIIGYISNRGLLAIKENTTNEEVALDYLAIFAKSEKEYNDLLNIASKMGTEVDKKTNPTGHTFKLGRVLETPAGALQLLKVRKHDPTRPQRGAPDFKVKNYTNFKNKYLINGNNFTLMLRSDYEMMELKGKDVLVYFPSDTLGDRLPKKK